MVTEHTLYKFRIFYNLLLVNLWPGICFLGTVPWALVKNLYSSVTGRLESYLMVLMSFMSLPIFCLVFLSIFFDLAIDRLKKTKTRIVFLARREMHACWWWWSENAEVVANTFFVECVWTMACFPLLHGAQFYLEPCSLPTLTPPWLPVPGFFQLWDLLSSLSVSGHRITPSHPVSIEFQNPYVAMCRGLGDACPVQSWSCLTTFLCLSCLFHTMKQGNRILLNFLLVLRYLFSEQYIRLLLHGLINSIVTTIFPS